MADYSLHPMYAPGPSMFAVDPAAENGDVFPYAPWTSMVLVSAGHVLRRLGTKSEGPGAI